jgi:hypothetical protein
VYPGTTASLMGCSGVSVHHRLSGDPISIFMLCFCPSFLIKEPPVMIKGWKGGRDELEVIATIKTPCSVW